VADPGILAAALATFESCDGARGYSGGLVFLVPADRVRLMVPLRTSGVLFGAADMVEFVRTEVANFINLGNVLVTFESCTEPGAMQVRGSFQFEDRLPGFGQYTGSSFQSCGVVRGRPN
jgi:hypothetical protein